MCIVLKGVQLTDEELITLNTIRNNELICSDLIKNVSQVASLKQKGFVEEVTQVCSGTHRYRVTHDGEIFYQEYQHSLINW